MKFAVSVGRTHPVIPADRHRRAARSHLAVSTHRIRRIGPQNREGLHHARGRSRAAECSAYVPSFAKPESTVIGVSPVMLHPIVCCRRHSAT